MPSRPAMHRPVRLKMSDGRQSASARGYGRDWQKLRAAFLAQHPVCEVCRREPATEVDHTQTIRQGGERLSEGNLVAMCKSCHSRKTVTTDGGFGRVRA